jgi:DNA-binding GntR family transcriptional regulator
MLTKNSAIKNEGQKPRGRPKGAGATVVYEALRRRILDLTIEPGADIEELGLVEEFGVSRTPVREALIRLASDGLATIMPNKSARVAALNFAELPQYFEALELTQRAVTRWAALRGGKENFGQIKAASDAFDEAVQASDVIGMIELNRKFHALIGVASGNIYLARTYSRLLDEGLRLARLSYAYEIPDQNSRAHHIDRTVSEHGEMVTAIETRNGDLAEQQAAIHARNFRERIMAYVGQDLSGEIAIDSVAG